MVPDPVVAYFTATPVSTCELGEAFCTALFGSQGTDVESHLWNFLRICGAGAMDDDQAACPGQVRLQRFEGVNVYRALIKASVCDVGLFGVGKKGGASSAALWALW